MHTHDLIDSAPCHRKREVIDKLQEHQIDPVFIPPRMKPAEVSCIRKFKYQYSYNLLKYL